MKLEIVNKHAIFRKEDESVLLDTGSPVTIKRQQASVADMLGGLMANLGLDEALKSQVLAKLNSEDGRAIADGLGLSDGRPLVDLDDLSRKIGLKIDKLLGTDEMSSAPVFIDYKNQQIEFPANEGFEEAVELPCRILAGIPVVTIQVAGVDRQMFLDTGAPTSYLSSDITTGMTPVGEMEDFHPQVGRFTTSVFELETAIADYVGKITYGNLPRALAQYEQVGCDGIIGYDFFSRFAVLLNLRDESLKVKRV